MLSENDRVSGAVAVFIDVYGLHECSAKTGWSESNLRAAANNQIPHYSLGRLEELVQLLPVPASYRGSGLGDSGYDREDMILALESAALSLRARIRA